MLQKQPHQPTLENELLFTILFASALQKIVIKKLKQQGEKTWNSQWKKVKPLWDTVLAQLEGNLTVAINELFNDTWFWKNEADRFATAEENAHYNKGYSIPRDYVIQRVRSSVLAKNRLIDTFKAVNLDDSTIEDLTNFFLSTRFDKVLEDHLEKPIGGNRYVLLAVMEEAYRVNSPDPKLHMLIKLGDLNSVDGDSPKKKTSNILRAWKERNKSRPPRYTPGSFYEANF